MKKYKIVVLQGDGIGREVIPQALRVLKAVEEINEGFNLEFIEYPCGAQYWLKSGKKEEWPPEAFEVCEKEADAILHGAIGWTNPDGTNISYSDGTMVGVKVLFGLRFGLDLYANIRPTKLYPCVLHNISGEFKQVWKPENVDFVCIRENTEDMYCDTHGKLKRGGIIEIATDVRLITRKGSERIIKYAFEYCRRRNKGSPKDKKLRVTTVDKSNVLGGCKFFREIYQEIAKNYPEIQRDYYFIDAFSQWIIMSPESFDVVVLPNMFGDIATDLAAVLQGGLGMAPSGNVNEEKGKGMFEPVHGSAPRLAGKNEANPIAAILTASMLLNWLGTRKEDTNLETAANQIELAVKELLKEGKIKTQDIGGNSKTTEVGDAVVYRIKTFID